jgi:hypothetical protein
MDASTLMPEPGPTPGADRAEALLLEMAEVGLRLTRAFERHVLCAEEVQVHQAKTDPDVMIMPSCDLAGVALAFNRVSRAVRMTVALRHRLMNPRPWRAQAVPGAAATTAPTASTRPTPGPDLPVREETRENLFDTPDVADLPDWPVRSCVAMMDGDLGAFVRPPADRADAKALTVANPLDTSDSPARAARQDLPRKAGRGPPPSGDEGSGGSPRGCRSSVPHALGDTSGV